MAVTELRKGCFRCLAELIGLVLERAMPAEDGGGLQLFALAKNRGLGPQHVDLLMEALVLFHDVICYLEHLYFVYFALSGWDCDLTVFAGFLEAQLCLEQLYFSQRLVFLLDFEVYLSSHGGQLGFVVSLRHHEAVFEMADAVLELLIFLILLEEYLNQLLNVDVLAELVVLSLMLQLSQLAGSRHLQILENLFFFDVLLELFLELANQLLVLLRSFLSDAELLLQNLLPLISDFHPLPECVVVR